MLGVGIYFLMSQIDLTEAAKRWKWLLGFGIVMFLLLKTPLGIENNGNRAWLGIEGFPGQYPAGGDREADVHPGAQPAVGLGQGELGLKSLRSIAVSGGGTCC